jgi:hypothetical protein
VHLRRKFRERQGGTQALRFGVIGGAAGDDLKCG